MGFFDHVPGLSGFFGSGKGAASSKPKGGDPVASFSDLILGLKETVPNEELLNLGKVRISIVREKAAEGENKESKPVKAAVISFKDNREDTKSRAKIEIRRHGDATASAVMAVDGHPSRLITKHPYFSPVTIKAHKYEDVNDMLKSKVEDILSQMYSAEMAAKFVAAGKERNRKANAPEPTV